MVEAGVWRVTMPEGEVELNLDARTLCRILDQVEALACGARLIVDAACSEYRLSARVGVAAARPLVEELRQLSEATGAALDDFEQKHASREDERAVSG
jgi:hypothetical protein